MTTVIVTRPEPFNEATSDAVRALGNTVIRCPLLRIEPVEGVCPILDKPYVAITSRTAISLLETQHSSELKALWDSDCFCVGQETAKAAQEAGLKVTGCAPSGADLARLILDQDKRPILHICGEETKDEPKASLTAAGWGYFPWVIYRTIQATAMTPETIDALRGGGKLVALFYSSRTAQAFINLVRNYGLESCCRQVIAVGLSDDVRLALSSLTFERIDVAATLSEAGMLQKLTQLCPTNEVPMTENDETAVEKKTQETPSVQKEDLSFDEVEAAPSTKRLSRVVVGVVIVMLGLAGAYIGWLKIAPSITTPTGAVPTSASVPNSDASAQAKALEARIEVLEQKLSNQTLNTSGGLSGADSGDLENLKNGLAGLSNALTLLQTEIEKSSNTVNENRLNSEAGFATIVAFLEMQRKAQAGEPFEKERQAMREVAQSDQTLIDMLMKLENIALSGAPSASTLEKEWRHLSLDVQRALNEARAQTWYERILVAIDGLISIRSLNPKASESLSFATITLDLEQGRVESAAAKIEAMPADVQSAIGSWKQKLDMRRKADQLLAEITDHLIVRGKHALPETPVDAAVPETPPEKGTEP